MPASLLFALLGCSEYDLTGKPGHDGAPDTAADTGPGVDTAGSGGRDSGAGEADGSVPDTGDPCDAADRRVRVGLAVDDVFELYIDGVAYGGVEEWWTAHWYEATVGCGAHTVAVHGTDLHQAISGFIAVVEVDGAMVSATGDGAWRVAGEAPGGDWTAAAFDDSAWGAGWGCDVSTARGWWGSSPVELTDLGAWWIWPRDCLALGEGWFRYDFVVD